MYTIVCIHVFNVIEIDAKQVELSKHSHLLFLLVIPLNLNNFLLGV